MRVGIFGSCVSRDTCEYMQDAVVTVYVARHSVASLMFPHKERGLDVGGINSPFQQRMVLGDLHGSGLDRISGRADALDVVLVDLVDERRGYWRFPDGTMMTNSLELEACGASRQARQAGARLVKFGTDEHFDQWVVGFDVLVEGLKSAKLLSRSIFIDIEWAAAIEGAQHPQKDTLSLLGRRVRRLQRGTREANRSLLRGQGLSGALRSLRHVRPTEAEEYSDRAFAANADYSRYREIARSKIPSTVTRTSEQVRIGRDHKWGPQPFHYRDEDYRSIVQSVRDLVEKWGTSSTDAKAK